MISGLRSRAVVMLGGITALAVIAAVLLAAYTGEEPPGAAALDEIRQSGELRVLTRNGPTSYYVGPRRVQGPEYDMVTRFADYLDVEVSFEIVGSTGAIIDDLAAARAPLAAAGISRSVDRAERVIFGPGYQSVEQQVVCRRNGTMPRGIDDLGRLGLTVAAGTSYAERLRRLSGDYPELIYQTTTERTTEELLRQVWKRALDCTVADSNLVAINRRYYPELAVAFTLGAPDTLAWVMPRGAERLRAQVRAWFSAYEDSGALDRAMDRYYGFVEVFDYVDTKIFHRRIDSRLPKYRPIFEAAGEAYGFAWPLLAAQSYQESHWNPRARSPTGVRGMMMLTRRTAKSLGVDNRLDPEESILAGAKYLKRMHDRVGDEVPEPDRTWLALAAYNIGFGHLRDARRLSERLGGDPNRWVDVKQSLPRLIEPEHYRQLQYGYARGTEPVRYVRHIRDYRDILRRALTDAGLAKEGE